MAAQSEIEAVTRELERALVGLFRQPFCRELAQRVCAAAESARAIARGKLPPDDMRVVLSIGDEADLALTTSCAACKGDGKIQPPETWGRLETCPRCGGSGRRLVDERHAVTETPAPHGPRCGCEACAETPIAKVYRDGYLAGTADKAAERERDLLAAANAAERITAARLADLSRLEPVLQFFQFAHLPETLQPHSAPFAELAIELVETLPNNPERRVALRKLLEAKDCAVRARTYKTGKAR